MASLGGIRLGDGAGSAFELLTASRVSAIELVDDWVIEVVAGSSIVVARVAAARTYEEALVGSLAAAQKGLDLWSVKGIARLATHGTNTDYITWWVEPPMSQVARLVSYGMLISAGMRRACSRLEVKF